MMQQPGQSQGLGSGAMPASQGLKPTWRGLTTGGDWASPLVEFAGLLKQWSTKEGTFGVQIILHFERVQAIRSDTPYVEDTADITIKYSGAENSAWGKFGDSVATALGVDRNLLDIDQLVNQNLHMLRNDNVSFGFSDKVTGLPATGTVWQLLSILAVGAQAVPVAVPAPTPVSPAAVIPPVAAPAPVPAVVVPTPTPTVTPVVAPAPVATPAPVAATPAPTTPMSEEGTEVPVEESTPEETALAHLDGKTAAQFFQAALPDTTVRKDQSLVNSILGNTYIQAQLASGTATVDEAGVHHVVPA